MLRTWLSRGRVAILCGRIATSAEWHGVVVRSSSCSHGHHARSPWNGPDKYRGRRRRFDDNTWGTSTLRAPTEVSRIRLAVHAACDAL
ncbi:hypothetical protein QBC45DRAFT_404585 [Copromyces sp. CBS 386.78]|nr:hypothetical protein QBC45DRAFT_404585 [Copromyces sp. CBS 386.78]